MTKQKIDKKMEERYNQIVESERLNLRQRNAKSFCNAIIDAYYWGIITGILLVIALGIPIVTIIMKALK